MHQVVLSMEVQVMERVQHFRERKIALPLRGSISLVVLPILVVACLSLA